MHAFGLAFLLFADLRIDAPDACIDEAAVRARAPRKELAVSVTRAAHDKLRVVVTHDGRERALLVASCAEATRAVEMVLALAENDEREQREQREQRERAERPDEPNETVAPKIERDAASAALPVEPQRAATPDVAAPTRTHESMRIALGAGGVVDAGTLPSVAPGFRAGIAAERSAWRVSLGGAFLPPQGSGAPGVSVELVTAQARACVLPLRRAVLVGACAGADVGRVIARGVDLREARSASAWWVAAGSDAWAALPLGAGARAIAEMGAAIPLERTTFYAEGSQRALHRPGAVVARASLGIEVTLR